MQVCRFCREKFDNRSYADSFCSNECERAYNANRLDHVLGGLPHSSGSTGSSDDEFGQGCCCGFSLMVLILAIGGGASGTVFFTFVVFPILYCIGWFAIHQGSKS
jgi:hypothetical protein